MQARTLRNPRARDRWQPSDGDRYFMILGHGHVSSMVWRCTQFDYDTWQFGNCFQTRGEAQEACALMKDLLQQFTYTYDDPQTPSAPCPQHAERGRKQKAYA